MWYEDGKISSIYKGSLDAFFISTCTRWTISLTVYRKIGIWRTALITAADGMTPWIPATDASTWKNGTCRSARPKANRPRWASHYVCPIGLCSHRQSSIYTATTHTLSTTRRAFSLIHKTKWPAWNATRIRSCCEQTFRVCDIMRQMVWTLAVVTLSLLMLCD